jgi:hypothetical protein
MIILLLSPRLLTATRLISEKQDSVCQQHYYCVVRLSGFNKPAKIISFTPIIIIIIIIIVIPVHNIRIIDHKMIDSSCEYLLQSNDAK